jgi:hypothetical protein
MNKIILGFLLGILTSFLILYHINWKELISPQILKVGFATFLALLAGLIALYQVKANVISSARIKWIEEFKTNVSEFISSTNESLFAYDLHIKGEKDEKEYYNKAYIALNKSHVLENKIRLNLNLAEPLHVSIEKHLDQIKEIMNNDELKVAEKENLVAEEFHYLANFTSKMIKLEWEKSKKMFYSRWWNKLNE